MARRKARSTSRPRPEARGATPDREGAAPSRATSPVAAKAPSPPARSLAGRFAGWLPPLLLVLVTLLAYAGSLRNGFIWDDDAYVTANRTLRSLDGLRRIWLEPGAVPQYYPLTFSTLWLGYQVHGPAPLGYHLVNVLLHAANAVLVWLVLRALSIPGALLAAAIFAVHPVHVESVAWITERKNVLSGTFYLSALLAYLRFAGIGEDRASAASSGGAPAPRRALYALALVLFACGLLAKTVVCTLPVVLLILVWWKRGRPGARDLLPLLPLLVLGAALALVTVRMESSHVGAVGRDWDLSLVERCLIAGRALWFYLGKIVWPAQLAFFYPRWTIDASAAWQYLFPAAALAAALLLAALAPRIGAAPLVAALFFAITLAPALGFVNVFPMRYSFVADHFQYLASLGPIVLLAALATLAVRRMGARARRPALALAAALVALLAWASARQAESYRDLRTLWTDTIAANPAAWMAHNNLGLLLFADGDTAAAMAHYRAAIAVKPDDAFARNNLGRALAAEGRLDDAVATLDEAVRLEPGNAEAWSNLGNALAAESRYDDAIRAYQGALRARPSFADAYSNLGNVLLLTGRTGEAVAAYRHALALDPDFADARSNLAVALSAEASRGAAR